MHSEGNILRSVVKIPFTEEDKNRVKGLISPKIDWRLLINLASNCDILPIFAQNLLSIDSDYIPKPELNEISKRHRKEYTVNNVILWNEFKKILEIAKKKQISIIPIKGIVLSGLLYNDLGLRRISDIDFLIKKEDLLKIEPELLGLEYISFYRNYYLKNHCHCVFEKKGPMGISIVVDAHWDVLFPSYRRIDNLINDFWANATMQDISGEDILVLSFEDLLFEAIIELYKDLTHTRRFLIKRHLDILQILHMFGQKINWDKFVKRAEAYKIHGVVYYTLRANKELFNSKIISREILDETKPSFSKTIFIHGLIGKTQYSRDAFELLRILRYFFVFEGILLSHWKAFFWNIFNLAFPEFYYYNKKKEQFCYFFIRGLKLPWLIIKYIAKK